MNIIRKTETLTPNDLYSMTKGNNVRKMADAKGETLEVAKFVLYEDTDTNGEIMEVLAFETVDGTRYATNSRTFIRLVIWRNEAVRRIRLCKCQGDTQSGVSL